MSDQVGNPEDRFSVDAAHMSMNHHSTMSTVLLSPCNQLASMAVAPFTVSDVTFSLFSVWAGVGVLGFVAFFLIALLRIQ